MSPAARRVAALVVLLLLVAGRPAQAEQARRPPLFCSMAWAQTENTLPQALSLGASVPRGSWEALDRAREALRPEFEQAAAKDGVIISGWGDLGRLRSMTRGFAVRAPEDLRGKRVMSFRTDSTSSPRRPWSPSSCSGRGMVWSRRRLDALPADLRAILRDTGAAASRALGQRVRGEDDAAFARLSAKMTVVRLEESGKKRWTDLFAKVRARLAQGTFSPELVKRVEQLGAP